MSWTSYLPNSPERLSTLEWWLWTTAAIFVVITAALGFIAREVGRYRASIEKTALQSDLGKALEERDAKTRQLEEMTAEARKKVIEIESKHAPRRLPPSLQAQLIELLSPGRGTVVKITSVLGDGEAIQYANDLMSTLKAAGWTVDGISQAVYAPPNPIGLLVSIKDRQTPPQGAILLMESLDQVGMQVVGTHKPSLAPGIIELVVGNKPE